MGNTRQLQLPVRAQWREDLLVYLDSLYKVKTANTPPGRRLWGVLHVHDAERLATVPRGQCI